MNKKQRESEAQWQIESDARTIVEAGKIMQDKNRLKKAQKQVEREMTAQKEGLKALNKSVSSKPIKKKKLPKKKKGKIK